MRWCHNSTSGVAYLLNHGDLTLLFHSFFILHLPGRHLQFYLESDEQSSGSEPFIVPYTDIRESIGQSEAQFEHAWQTSLKAASDDYTHRMRVLWELIFDDLVRKSGRDELELRGLPHDEAIQLHVSTMSESRSRDLFTSIKKTHSSASMNAEALRKLVKKFDKGATARGDDMLTSTLIPELYSATFMAYPILEGHIETLRDTLEFKDEEEEMDDDSAMHSIRQKALLSTKDSADVKRRADEMSWLHDLLENIPSSEIPRLVAHRGKNIFSSVWYLYFLKHLPTSLSHPFLRRIPLSS